MVYFPCAISASDYDHFSIADRFKSHLSFSPAILFSMQKNAASVSCRILCTSAWICCGYPMGVKTLADLRSDDAISSEEAHYLTYFINNVSPGFLIACVCHDLLKAPGFAIPCMVMVYGAALCYGAGILAMHRHRREMADFPDMTAKTSGPPYGRKCSSGHTTFLTFLDTSIEDSITQMLKIGGYMVLFSVLSFFVCHLPALSAITRASLAALLEISLGCQLLARLSVPLSGDIF